MMSNEKNVLVSVIIPVYNGEIFLEKTLMKLAKQTLEEIEIICVNNASTDKSLLILEAFKEVFPDKFIIVDSKTNGGPGGGRNLGLAYASGEYIAFVDQDDICSVDKYEQLYKEAVKESYDIVSCGYYVTYNKEYEEMMPLKIRGNIDLNDKIKLCCDITFVWNKLFKRELFSKMSCLFRENHYDDDVDFCTEAILRSKKVSYVEKFLHIYNITENSTTFKNDNLINLNKYIDDIANLYKAMNERIKAAGYAEHLNEICRGVNNGRRIGNLLYYIVSVKEFNYDLFCLFDSIAKLVAPKYYEKRFDKENQFAEVWEYLEEDKEKSFQNLMEYKKTKSNSTDKP